MLKKIEPWELEEQVKSTRFINDGTLTIAIVTLNNGMKLVGKSACINPADYNQQLGEDIARADAVNQLWPLMAYHRFETSLLSGLGDHDAAEPAGEARTSPTAEHAGTDANHGD